MQLHRPPCASLATDGTSRQTVPRVSTPCDAPRLQGCQTNISSTRQHQQQHHFQRPLSTCRTATFDEVFTAESAPPVISGLNNLSILHTIPAPSTDLQNPSLNNIAGQDLQESAVLASPLSLDRPSASSSSTPASYSPAFKVGDVVYAKIISTNTKGSRAEISYHKSLRGFVPLDQSPLMPEEWAAGGWQYRPAGARQSSREPLHSHGVPLNPDSGLTKGLTRPFKVTAIPPDMQPGLNQKGPLLSAYKYDLDMYRARVSQIRRLTDQEGGILPLSVRVHGFNANGLKTSLCGLEATIPVDHVCIRQGLSWNEVAAQLVGQEIQVCMSTDSHNGIILSETTAWWQRVSKPGNVVWGTVQNFATFGAFVHLEDLGVDGLLHNNHISSEETLHADEVFRVGERIACVIISSAQGRISLSTKLLEQQYGEIVNLKEYVFARTAEGPGIVRLSLEEDKSQEEQEREREGARREEAYRRDEAGVSTAVRRQSARQYGSRQGQAVHAGPRFH